MHCQLPMYGRTALANRGRSIPLQPPKIPNFSSRFPGWRGNPILFLSYSHISLALSSFLSLLKDQLVAVDLAFIRGSFQLDNEVFLFLLS